MAKEIYGTKVWALLWWAFINYALLIAAVVQAVQGDWAPALFFAVLWHGASNNTSNSLVYNLIRTK